MQSIDRSLSVAQLVTDHAALAQVFQNYGIDFCCQGKMTVEQACTIQRLDTAEVYRSLDTVLAQRSAEADLNAAALSTPALVAYVVSKHHAYLNKALPYISSLSAKVARVHGGHNPKLIELDQVYVELKAALEPHLEQEERVLFPALVSESPDPSVVRLGLDDMLKDHFVVGKALASLRTLSDQFTTPEWGCQSYRTLMAELRALEDDTLRHVHLENHVLMPRFAG